MGLSRRIALRRSADIRRVLDEGRRVGDGVLKVSVLVPGGDEPSRFAVVTPKFKHSIVERNRLKRRLQEIMRAEDSLARGRLLVLRVTPDAYSKSYSELRERFSRLTEKISGTGGSVGPR